MLLLGLQLWGLLPALPEGFLAQRPPCRLPLRKNGRPFLIGLLTGLLPCASLSALWLCALAARSPLLGALRMLAFALGTVPLLFFFAALGSLVPPRARRYLNRASAMLIAALGLKMLLAGLSLVH